VSLIKVDVEGGELGVLRGARRILEGSRPLVICEVNPEFLARYGHHVGDLDRFMRERGYGIYRYQEAVLKPACLERSRNYVFVHPDRIGRMRGSTDLETWIRRVN